jgi:hypothetical protein
MESRDQARPDDVACGVCREPVAHDRTRLVASRDDLVFLELHCRACSSVTLGFVFTDGAAGLPESVRLAGARPVSADDVLDMHQYLGGWRGDLRSLLAGGGSPAHGAGR